MSSPLRWLPLLVVVASLVGCQSAPHGEVDPLTSTASPTGTFSPAPVVTELPANRVTLSWTLLGMSADGRRLFITYGVGDGCADYEGHVYVQQTSDYVAIASAPTGSGAVFGSPGGTCPAMLKTADGYVDLAEPLGTRKLIHLDQNAG
ncbi:MAG: hypothetical protein CVT62_06450 [Actinobacteria bacterium HGW-Actinobacteria-2]|nr:MAG: hypothetical protein CVT62_06450 [Actinobacteria bacterium HGW-Actinobacteria-2]